MIESSLTFLTSLLVLAAGLPWLGARCGRRFSAVVPPIVFTYGVTTLLAVGGLWAGSAAVAESRDQVISMLLPGLVFALLLPCDLRAVARVGPKLLGAFAAATITIMAGFVIAWMIWRRWLPADGWQVLAGVAGGWVGGTANLVAVLGSLDAAADITGLAVLTDTICYSVWVLALFSLVGSASVFNRWAGSPSARPSHLSEPLPNRLAAGHQPAGLAEASAEQLSMTGLAFGLVVSVGVGQAAAGLAGWLPTGGPFSSMSWTILLSTMAGAIAAQTPLGRLSSAEPLAAALLAVVIVAVASQATLAGLQTAPVFVAVGFTVLACHAGGMVAAARVLKLDLASCCVASLANIGGVASAPLMAALHAPRLVPAAVLLALMGYLIGLPAGLMLAALLTRLGGLPATLLVMVVTLTADNAVAADPVRQTAEFWVARCPQADEVLLDADDVAKLQARFVAADPTLRDLASMPATLPRAELLSMLERRSTLPAGPLYRASAARIDESERHVWDQNVARADIPDTVVPELGLVLRRSAIRRLPTRDRLFSDPSDTDIDRLQETAAFPGSPLAVLHRSADMQWAFVVTPHYEGWIAADAIATGSRDAVLGYVAAATRMITGSRVRTAFTPELPELSQLSLDMGTVLPELAGWPQNEPVNGQAPWASHVVQLPFRGPGGTLSFRAALLPRSADTHAGPLPATRANVIKQACKFLGDRYGWGHDYDSRDCSGLVCDVYRSLGLLLPRNTSDQAVCPAVHRTPVAADVSREERLAAIASLAAGDLIYLPGHVMMVVGHAPDTWVIHATHGKRSAATVNGVVIMPLAEATTNAGDPIIDSVTTLVRVLPSR